MSSVLPVLAAAVMAVALITIPFGLPGVWIMVGVLLVAAGVGLPVPLVGSIIAAFLGSFLGAAVVTLYETRSAGHATRVGWGVFLARLGSVVLKVGVGAVVLAVGVWELIRA